MFSHTGLRFHSSGPRPEILRYLTPDQLTDIKENALQMGGSLGAATGPPYPTSSSS